MTGRSRSLGEPSTTQRPGIVVPEGPPQPDPRPNYGANGPNNVEGWHVRRNAPVTTPVAVTVVFAGTGAGTGTAGDAKTGTGTVTVTVEGMMRFENSRRRRPDHGNRG